MHRGRQLVPPLSLPDEAAFVTLTIVERNLTAAIKKLRSYKRLVLHAAQVKLVLKIWRRSRLEVNRI